MRKSQLNEAYDDWVGEDVRDQDIVCESSIYTRALNENCSSSQV